MTKGGTASNSPLRKLKSVRNRILATLPEAEYKRIFPLLTRVSLPAGHVLYEVDDRIRYGYFVNSGLASTLSVMSNGDCVEVGIIGSEGFAGLPLLLNISKSCFRLIMQVAGDALRIESEVLQKLVGAVPVLEHQLFLYSYLQALHMAQIAACNQHHRVEKRLARWLLMVQDRTQTNVLPLTHEFLGNMLGARRASVTIATGTLQKAGIIERQRGKIRILDRQQMEEIACECYQTVRRQFQAYLRMKAPAPYSS